ncbi:hypothetical protein C8J57DRAFT_1212584 [Mycena rebaudengoi]|nr:hypothetical protein C8J57DRAFT_1212584 [Mycena rebaudengoi]
MTMMRRTAMRETITGGSSAPPARQAPFPLQHTSLEQDNKLDVTGNALRAVWRQSQTDAEKRRWWRTAPLESKNNEITREADTGGKDTPPRGKFPTQIPPHARTRMSQLQKFICQKNQQPTRRGKSERRRDKAKSTNCKKQREREQLMGEGQLSPARQRQTSRTNRSTAPSGGEQLRKGGRRGRGKGKSGRSRKRQCKGKQQRVQRRSFQGWLGRKASSGGSIPRRNDWHGGR